MEQSSQVGVYFLIGEDTEDGDRLVYVGQTPARPSSPADRPQPEEGFLGAETEPRVGLQNQQPHADPRSVPGVACPPADSGAGRFADENGNSGSRPHTPAPLEAECFEVFETGSVLVSSLGYPLFDPVASWPATTPTGCGSSGRCATRCTTRTASTWFCSSMASRSPRSNSRPTTPSAIDDAVCQYKNDRLPQARRQNP